MLLAKEFTVGSLADAQPLALIVPRGKSEEAVLVGHSANGPAAVFIDRGYEWFECSDNRHWVGLIIPGVRIEIDETSVFDPRATHPRVGTIVRSGEHLSIIVKAERSGEHEQVVLEAGLPPTGDVFAAFTKWRIVLGEGIDKRVLREITAELQHTS